MKKNEEKMMTAVINGRTITAKESVVLQLEAEDKTLNPREKAIKTFEKSKETVVSAPYVISGEHKGKYKYKREHVQARVDSRVEARESLREKWGYLGEARDRKKVKVIDVTYVPEMTFKAFETSQDTLKSRMLVECKEPWTDKRYMVNIADAIHEVGNCTRRRAEKLKATMPEYVRIVNGCVCDADLTAWLVRAGIK